MSNSMLIHEHAGTGFGVNISEAASSEEAIVMAGLDWTVTPKPAYFQDDGGFHRVPNVFANVRDIDGKPLGTVTGRYAVVQNREAFNFTDALLGEGIKFVRGGSFHGGRSTWLEAELPEDKIILGDPVHQNLVFLNSFDGSGSVRVMIAPVRIVCSNAINYFVRKAMRRWSAPHSGEIAARLEEAKKTLLLTEKYMEGLGELCEELQKIELTEADVISLTEKIYPISDKATERTVRNVTAKREGLLELYRTKEDLLGFGNTGYRFVNAVSDYATHSAPQRMTRDYFPNLFEKTINGHPEIDRAVTLLAA